MTKAERIEQLSPVHKHGQPTLQGDFAMSVYDYRDRPAYGNEDWPPYSNRNIAKWWTAEHDELLARLIAEWQWSWYWEVADAVVSITSKEAIAPFLETYA
jgi:hypothetical protein